MQYADRPQFTPIDLGRLCNGGGDLLERAAVPLGAGSVRGIPVHVGSPEADRPLIVLSQGMEIEVAVHAAPSAILFGHALERPEPVSGFFGAVVARYAFRGEAISEVVRLREHEHIGLLAHGPARRPDGTIRPTEVIDRLYRSDTFLAFPVHEAGTFPLAEGRWSDSGLRRTAVTRPYWGGLKFWVWMNRRGRFIEHITLSAMTDAQVVIGAITLVDGAALPVGRLARHHVLLDLDTPIPPARLRAVQLGPDAGVILGFEPRQPSEAHDMAGWGSVESDEVAHGYAIAGLPGTPVTGGRGSHAVATRDRVAATVHDALGAVHVAVVRAPATWTRIVVRDAGTGRPVACRISIRSPDGVPCPPEGHPADIGDRPGTWGMGVGGDVRLGATTYAYIDGECWAWLPSGRLRFEVAKGFEFRPIVADVAVEHGQREIELRLERWADMRADGWYSGDTHVHFLSVETAHLEASAEDLAAVHLLAAQWGELTTNLGDWTGETSVSRRHGTAVHVGQENRQHILGHLGILGGSQLVRPFASDGAAEDALGGRLRQTLAGWAVAGRACGATVIASHFGHPLGELSALVAGGRLDAVEMIWQSRFSHGRYYDYLDAGFRVPLVAGTDKMSNEVPVGIYRTYVWLGDQPFSMDAWLAGVRAGRTFISAGPLLDLRVLGARPGETIRLPDGDATVHVAASARSIGPLGILEIVANGKVVASRSTPDPDGRLVIDEDVRMPISGWVVARAGGGRSYFESPVTNCDMRRGIVAHTSPIYLEGRKPLRARAVLRGMEREIAAVRRYIRTHERDLLAPGEAMQLVAQAAAGVRERLDPDRRKR